MQRIRGALAWMSLVMALAAGLAALPGSGQGVIRDGRGPGRVYPPTDRLMSRGMRRARESIEGGEFAQALVFLDELLGGDGDFFTETGEQGGYAGLKQTARHLIRDLPPEGRRTYEATYGPVAERQLREAIAEASAPALAAVVQRYFYSPAGYQAAMLLAANESDAGRHLSAALLYQQLLETPAAVRLYQPELSVRAAASWLAAGDAGQAQQVLGSLATSAGGAVEVGGRQYSMEAIRRQGELEWLRETVGEPADASAAAPEAQWLTYRGNAARNGQTDGSLPHMRVRWKVALLRPHAKLEELFEEYRADLEQSGQATPVASAPLAAGDYVLIQTAYGLLAVDFDTGKRIWRSELQRDPQLEQLVKAGSAPEDEATTAEAARAFARRMWEDYLYGIPSSDGDRVYVIRDLPLPVAQEFESSGFMTMPTPDVSASTNRLSAYDLGREGTLVWEIDGAVASGELQGAFFLGAPLAMGPSLYVLAEIRDDIYLAALDRESGAVQWRQQLANLETGVLFDLQRRLQSAMPSYDGGMLVCPTGAGLIVGVDLAQRSLAWAYQYDALAPSQTPVVGRTGEPAPTNARWTDGAATIADGCVLVTPPDSSDLHCLDLRTGKLLWKQAREGMARLACVEDSRALLVGNRSYRAVRLKDGVPAWNPPLRELPPEAAPSGSGFVSSGRYYFPLTTSEVIAVNLADGEIADRVQSRDGAPLGNLICHRGAVISQNGFSLDCFDQIEVLRKRSQEQLAADAGNAEALRSLAEIAYNEGQLDEALDLAERAYRQSADDLQTQELLGECLSDALDADFARHQSRLPLLRELQRGGAISPLDALRIEAQGMLASGDVQASFDACLAMYRAAAPPGEMLKLRGGHDVLLSRWVQSQLAEIWDAASPDARTSIGNRVGEEIKSLGDDPTAEQIERLLAYIASLSATEPLKLTWARMLNADGQPLEAQQILLDLRDSPEAAIRAEATARLATQLHESGLASLARDCDAALAGEFANQPCLDGATGGELVQRWAAAAKSAGYEPTIDWPHGRVDVRTLPTGGDVPMSAARGRAPVWSVRLEHSDSILGSGVGYLAMRGGELTWHDGYGRQFYSVGLEAEMQALYRQTGSVYASSRGNLLVMSLGRELIAFNTLARGDGQAASLAWRAGLGSNFDHQDVYLEELSRSGETPPGTFRAPRMKFNNKWIGVIGPMSAAGCVYQDQRRLVCVDATTGATLWSRSDVPAGCDLFGDDRYVFATPNGSTTAHVFSAIDGRALGEREVPRWLETVMARGRTAVSWKQSEGGLVELAAVDALSGAVAWRHEFAVRSRVDLDADRFVAVAEPTGRVVVVDATSGQIVAQGQATAAERLGDVHLLVDSASFVVAIAHPGPGGRSAREMRAFSPGDTPIFSGEILALDRATGAARWSRPASVARQPLLLNLPPNLPFLAFAGTQMSRSRGERSDSTSLLLIDKQSGRTLINDDTLPQSGAAYCLASVTNAAERQVTIDISGRLLEVTYTARRRPPEPPLMAEVESGASPSGGIFGIFRSFGGSE